MRFSIVTPSYNQAEFIETTIKSVLHQQHGDFEYIVVDGGSTDGTREILEDYSHVINKIIIEPDEGQADAINKGFRQADGDIYAYLNSDDYYLESTLKVVDNIFRTNPDVDVVYGDCVFTDRHGQFLRYFSEIWEYYPKKLLNNSNFIMQPSTFWRRGVFQKYGPFDKKLHYGFDWALWCELTVNKCKFLRIHEVLSANRVHGETKTISGGKQRLSELRKINKSYKTTVLNHAYYTFSFAELGNKKSKSLLDYMLQSIYFILSYQNIIFHIVHAKEKIINGVYPHSGYLRKNIRIKLPFYDNFSRVRIVLRTPGYSGQSVNIAINDDMRSSYLFNDDGLELELPVNSKSADVDINMQFSSEYVRPLNLVNKLKTFYQSRLISAELVELKLL